MREHGYVLLCIGPYLKELRPLQKNDCLTSFIIYVYITYKWCKKTLHHLTKWLWKWWCK